MFVYTGNCCTSHSCRDTDDVIKVWVGRIHLTVISHQQAKETQTLMYLCSKSTNGGTLVAPFPGPTKLSVTCKSGREPDVFHPVSMM